MEKEEELKNNKTLYKIFLLSLKYFSHSTALVYILYTMLGFYGIDNNIIGCFYHVSLRTLAIFILASFVFKFCYVHRLPLYYIGINELITSVDYYLNIPIDIFNLLIIHLLLVILLIFGYTFYYLKKK